MKSLISIGDRQIRSAPVGYCIYCDATEYRPGTGEPLHDEHVIPQSIGGTLILVEASCRACEELMNPFEQAVIKSIFQSPRKHLGVLGKKRSRPRVDTIRIAIGDNGYLQLPVSQAPQIMTLPGLAPPSSLTGHSDMSVSGWVHFLEPPTAEMKRLGSSSVGAVPMDMNALPRLITKIAHGYAVYTHGLGGFTPVLIPQIRGEIAKERRQDFVGGSLIPFTKSDSLHTISSQVEDWGQGPRLTVRVSLFSLWSPPTYLAVAGIPTAAAVV